MNNLVSVVIRGLNCLCMDAVDKSVHNNERKVK